MNANPTNIRFWMTPVVHPQWCWCWWWGLTLALPLPVILLCSGWVVSSWQGSGVHIILTCSSVSALHQDSVRSNGELALFPMNNQCTYNVCLTNGGTWMRRRVHCFRAFVLLITYTNNQEIIGQRQSSTCTPASKQSIALQSRGCTFASRRVTAQSALNLSGFVLSWRVVVTAQ